MFSNFGFGEIAVLALLGLLIFGPEKLPKAAADAARMIRQLRSMATSTVNDFKSDLGPDMADLDLKSLHPRRLIEKALRDDDPEPANPRPIEH
jgi:sec-independent protein translocase protein TatB